MDWMGGARVASSLLAVFAAHEWYALLSNFSSCTSQLALTSFQASPLTSPRKSVFSFRGAIVISDITLRTLSLPWKAEREREREREREERERERERKRERYHAGCAADVYLSRYVLLSGSGGAGLPLPLPLSLPAWPPRTVFRS